MNHPYEIILSPSDGSSGASLIKLIAALDLPARLPVVVISDIECNGDRRWAEQLPFASRVDELMEYAEAVSQFDWATFFFFPAMPYDCHISERQFDELFEDAEAVIRAVDDTWFYVYSPDEMDALTLARVFAAEFRKTRNEDIVHPF
jgi:hypothetical protein